jgi:iron complex outermembrane receptor protein
MFRFERARAWALGGASLAAMLAGGAAQAATAAAATDAPALEEVVVTAEKRTVDLQKAALAITAVSGELMAQSNINALDDLNGFVPGLTVAANEGAERVIAIRGVGYETPQTTDTQPGVAFHIDGVYISHPIALGQDLLDVNRIEVLRGPQGTVFGQASTGGAINVITNLPKLNEFSGNLNTSYGNYNYVKEQAAVNIPLGDTLALRGAVQYLRHDGYAKETQVPGTGGDYPVDDANRVGVRLALLWQPTSSFSAELSGQYFSEDNNAAAQKNILDPNPDPRELTQDFPGKFELITRMSTLVLKQDLPGAVLKSTTSYQDMYHNETAANDRSTFALAGYFDHVVLWKDTSRSWTQEVNLSSTDAGKLKWITGVFYLHQNALQDILEYSGTDPGVSLPLRDTDPAVVPGSFILPHDLKYQTNSPFQHTAIAGYAQGTYAFTPSLRLTAGARYNYDTTSAQPVNFFNAFGFTAPKSIYSTAPTGKVGLEYDLTPADMLYATYSVGYKPTGLNFNNVGLLVKTNFKQENVDSYEIGSKNRFFDNRLQLNVAAYYMDYRNFQLLSDDPVPNDGGVVNIPKAEIYGAEFEGSYILGGGFRLDGNLALEAGHFIGNDLILDDTRTNAIRAAAATAFGIPVSSAEYIPSVIAAVAASETNTNGKTPPKMPGTTGSLAVTYTHDLPSGGVLARIDATYRGDFQYRVFNDGPLDTVPSYVLWNLYMQYKPDRSPWKFSLTVDNLFNVAGVDSRFTDAYGSGTTSQQYIPPRQAFVTVSYAF